MNTTCNGCAGIGYHGNEKGSWPCPRCHGSGQEPQSIIVVDNQFPDGSKMVSEPTDDITLDKQLQSILKVHLNQTISSASAYYDIEQLIATTNKQAVAEFADELKTLTLESEDNLFWVEVDFIDETLAKYHEREAK